MTRWAALATPVENGQRFEILQDDAPLSVDDYLRLLETNLDFAAWYTDLLAGVEYAAFFWEHPPLYSENLNAGAEFVLLDSPALARLAPNPEPFRTQFERQRAADIITFSSLGGDAILLAPQPSEQADICAHLAAFVRGASRAQMECLWRETARIVRENLGVTKRWLSTSGLGVAWLHIRLDSYPKYYQHRPYAKMR